MGRDVSKYQVDGVLLPSVTECLDRAGFVDLSRIPWQVLEDARVRGVSVHAWLELLKQHPDRIRGMKPPPFIAGYVEAWERWQGESGFEIETAESVVVDETYLYGGMLDVFGMMKGRRGLVDYKARYGLTPEIGPQLAGYLGAARDGARRGAYTAIDAQEPVDRYALLLRPDATYRFELYTDVNDLQAFRCAVGVMHWQLANKLTTLEQIRSNDT